MNGAEIKGSTSETGEDVPLGSLKIYGFTRILLTCIAKQVRK
jgi:hypothetical protein